MSKNQCPKCNSENTKRDKEKAGRRNGNWWFEPWTCADCSHEFEVGEEIKLRGN